MSTAIRLFAAFVAVFVIHLLLYSLLFVLPLDVEQWQDQHGRTPEDPLYWPWNQVSHVLQVLFFVLLYWFVVPSRRICTAVLYGLLVGAYLFAVELGLLAEIRVISAPITYVTIPINLAVGMASGAALSFLLRDRKGHGPRISNDA